MPSPLLQRSSNALQTVPVQFILYFQSNENYMPSLVIYQGNRECLKSRWCLTFFASSNGLRLRIWMEVQPMFHAVPVLLSPESLQYPQYLLEETCSYRASADLNCEEGRKYFRTPPSCKCQPKIAEWDVHWVVWDGNSLCVWRENAGNTSWEKPSSWRLIQVWDTITQCAIRLDCQERAVDNAKYRIFCEKQKSSRVSHFHSY